MNLKRTLVGILIIALSIPVTLALIRVSQELRRRAAPPEIKTYRFTSIGESDGFLEKIAWGYPGTCFDAYDSLSSKPASTPGMPGIEDEVAHAGSFCLPWNLIWVKRLFLDYDTSSIPADEIIISAKICATIKSTSSSLTAGPITIDVHQYPWQTLGTLSPDGWDERSEEDFEGHLVKDMSEFPLVVDSTYYMDVDPTRINKEGRTEYRLSAQNEKISSGTHYLPFYTGDAANENFRPCLEVTTSTAPPPKAVIKGTKFEDIDGNQTQDNGESGMADVTIILKGPSGVEILRTTTNDDGYFEFTELDSGNYIVEEVVPNGYENTTPTAVEVNDLESGQEREVLFGNRTIPPPEKGRISGYKWNDQNGNGFWDTGEPPYPEGTIIILSGAASLEDSTNEVGYFEFDDLDPGNYTVEELVPEGWRATTATTVEVTLAGGEDEIVNFGNVFVPPARAKISGHKFNDLDGNSGWDTASESGIGQVVITLKDDKGAVLSSTETWEGTDLGYYLFENLEPGDYIVEETVPEGFQPTTATFFEVTLGAGDERQIDFGNREIGGGPQDPICQSLTAGPTSGTVPLTVNFTTTAMDPDGNIVSYEYGFGDGSDREVSPSSTASHIYQATGTYTASVRVQDNDGAWATSAGCQAIVTASSPETPTHKVCQGTSCVVIEGEGADECITDADCVEPTHTVCRDEACILIAGSGTNECTDDDDCKLDRHTICQTPANVCIEIEGAGTNRCTIDADCQPGAPPTHTICRDYKCVSVSGAGVNECSSDANCAPSPTHTVCQGPACVTVSGSGANQCASDADCVVAAKLPIPTPVTPVPPTASTAQTWTLIFSSLTLIALGILTIL